MDKKNGGQMFIYVYWIHEYIGHATLKFASKLKVVWGDF